jgi:hypothetical protein
MRLSSAVRLHVLRMPHYKRTRIACQKRLLLRLMFLIPEAGVDDGCTDI